MEQKNAEKARSKIPLTTAFIHILGISWEGIYMVLTLLLTFLIIKIILIQGLLFTIFASATPQIFPFHLLSTLQPYKTPFCFFFSSPFNLTKPTSHVLGFYSLS